MTDVVRRYFVDRSERTMTFVNVQDVEPILDMNKEERSETQNSDVRRIGRIPNTVLLKWYYDEIHRGNVGLRMYSEEFDEIMARKLDDPEYGYLRTDKKPTIITGFSF